MSDENTGKIVTHTYDPTNPPRLSAEQRERLDAMREKDEEIDLTDIPAQGDLHTWARPGVFGGAEGKLRLAALKDKVLVLDKDVIEFFEEEGAGAPVRMNAVLREYGKAHRRRA